MQFGLLLDLILKLVCRLEGRTKFEMAANKLLEKVFGPKKEKVTRKLENYIMRHFMVCIPLQTLLGG